MNVNRLILIVILTVLLPHQVLANSFGQTCSALPIADDSGYLDNNTAYGFIKNNIDIRTHTTQKCDASEDSFAFCIKNITGAPQSCSQVSLNIGDSAPLSSLTTNPDIVSSNFMRSIILSVQEMENEVCLTMSTSRGNMPLLCRDRQVLAQDNGENDDNLPTDLCATIGSSCFQGVSRSQSLFSFGGLSVHCLRNMLDAVFYTRSECLERAGEGEEENIALRMLRPFPEFQMAMTNIVRAGLALYIMFFGFKLVMNPHIATPNEIFMVILKVILVTYFSVGLWRGEIVNGVEVPTNGITTWLLPLFIELTARFAEVIFLAAGSTGLCQYDVDRYAEGFEFYRLWDAIDCRVAFYMGMQLMHNMGGGILDAASSSGAGADNLFSTAEQGAKMQLLTAVDNFAIFTVLFGFFMSGAILLVIMIIIFIVVFIGLIIYFLTAYMACLVTLYLLAYIAPIFVPMALFERTKSYFDSWMNLVLSCALQPAIIAGFIAAVLSVFDVAMYGNCDFNRVDYTFNDINFSTFQIALPNGDPAICQDSVGYKLLRYFSGEGWETKSLILFSVPTISDIGSMLVSMTYLMLYLALFYYFIRSANSMAARLTDGVDVGAVSVNPNMIADKLIGLVKAGIGLVTAAGRLAVGDIGGAIGDGAGAIGKAIEDTSSNKKRHDDIGSSGLVGSGDSGGNESKDANEKSGKDNKPKDLQDLELSDLPKTLK